MHFDLIRKARKGVRSLFKVGGALIFVILIFAFDAADAAVATLTAVVLHEAGHIGTWFFIAGRKGKLTLRAAANGLRLKGRGTLSYRQEAAVLAAGPLVNLAAFALTFRLPAAETFAWIEMLTAISNLLPVKGYDGYRLIEAFCLSRTFPISFLTTVSLLTSSLIALSALYFIGRIDGGYWVFFVFFLGILRDIGSKGQIDDI